MQRMQWGSRLGFILASAGATVGLGSIWKFPYVTAMNGGGAFLLVYLAFTFTLGLALLQAELAIGRAAGCGAVGAFARLGSRRWKLLGYSGVLCCFLVFSFYSVVGGWTLGYLRRALDGRVMNGDLAELGGLFGQYVGNPAESLATHALFAALTLLVVMGGVQKGIERAGKALMPLLFLLMLGLIARSLTLPGAQAGVEALFRPDFSKLTPAMLVEALGLACFSLSVGAGCMLAYGSYLGRDARLGNSALWVTGLTALTSVLAGLMIFPAIYAFGLDPQAGPGLTYMVMPAVFNHLPYGQLFAVLFFALLLMAALTSAVSLLEVVVVLPIDEFGVSRRKATLLVTALVFLAGIPAALSFGPLAEYKLFGRNAFELMDYAASNVLLPLGCIGTALFAGRVAWPAVSAELSLSALAAALMRAACRWLAPLLIGMVLVYNL
ncbi:sodium-dependent transporter [Chromobacterium sp. IIBBL 290-4]|uniref:sodium-dependent transporter n=1 Tax=Chromobacterium sp. IIBBL 290-4 TaxID=2953890 RepID=UPI0020B7A805|nr:sodium-dependent transporter [Chromobacterium sp. IIBBL 290-4]UTH75590.1 sodium-dependent transporter [Chromobacterium sp. IIBBL 290-4]